LPCQNRIKVFLCEESIAHDFEPSKPFPDPDSECIEKIKGVFSHLSGLSKGFDARNHAQSTLRKKLPLEVTFLCPKMSKNRFLPQCTVDFGVEMVIDKKRVMAIAGGSALTGASLFLAIGKIFYALQGAQNTNIFV
jgi:hypothetical protein